MIGDAEEQDPVSPGPTPKQAPSLELTLAQQANHAMEQGADPHAVTDRLGTMLRHLKANPDHAAAGAQALASGADPAAVASRVWSLSQSGGAPDQAAPATTSGGLKPVPPVPQHGALWNAAQTGAAHVLSAAQFVPGVEELEAGMGALGSHFPGQTPMTYEESYKNLKANTDKINPYVKTAEQTVASLPTMGLGAIARMSPMAAGALYGGLHGATNAEPNLSSGDVAQNAAKGTAIGALIGKGTELGATGIRALRSKDLDVNSTERAAARSVESDKNYSNALETAGPPTQAVQDLMSNEDFAPMADALQLSPRFRGMSPTDPQFLHEIYKGMSDESGALDKRLIPPNPTRGNSTQRQVKDIRFLKDQFLNALETPSTVATPPVPERVQSVRDAAGRLRGNLAGVADKELESEWQRMAELNAREKAMHGAVQDAGYRTDYEALPRTERLGARGQEDLPDADGMVDPDVLAGDNKVISDYNRSSIVRAARDKAMKRIQDELGSRPGATDFAFGANAEPRPQPAGPMMPGYRNAVEEHANRSEGINALENSSDAASRVMGGKPIAGRQLRKQSGAAFSRDIRGMRPSEAEAAQEGVLGRLQEQLGLNVNPLKGFGIPKSAASINRISPYVRQLDQQSGNTLPDLLAKLGIVAATPQ